MQNMNERRKYKYMDPVLDIINKNVVSLPEQQIKTNNEILNQFLDAIIPKMKQKDSLFNTMYQRVFYGGSFYDGLRVGEPSEFDLDLLLSLPKMVTPQVTISNKPGYVHVKLVDMIKLLASDLGQKYRDLYKLIDEKTLLLQTSKVLQWMESIVTLALKDFNKEQGQYVFNTSHGKFLVKLSKSGPAFTLKASGVIGGKSLNIDIDLVPCFVFKQDQWPNGGFRSNPVSSKPEFFIVPKPLKGENNVDSYWRLSFQEQERVLIDKKGCLKPTVKFLKLMRDNLGHKCIASYYLKTVLLWQADDKTKGNDFWNAQKSYVFMTMLKDYHRCLNSKKIPYFWNKNNNLIGKVGDVQLTYIANRIKAIIDDIEKHPDDPFVVAKYLLSSSDYQRLKMEKPKA